MKISEDVKKPVKKIMDNNNMTELYIKEFKGIVLKLQNDFGFVWSRDLGRVFFHVDALHSRIVPRLFLGDGVLIKVRPQEVKKDCHYRAVSVKRRKWWMDNTMQIYPNHQADGQPYDDNQIQVKVGAVVGSVWPERAILWSDQLGRLYFPFNNQSQNTIAQIVSKRIVQVTCQHIRPKVEDCHWQVSAVAPSKPTVAPTEYKATTAELHNAWRHWEVILKEKSVAVAAKENTFYMGLPDYYMLTQSLIDVTAVYQNFDVLVAPTQIHVTTKWRAFYACPMGCAPNDRNGHHAVNAPCAPITQSKVKILPRSRSQDDTKQVEAKFQFLEQELSQLWGEAEAQTFVKTNSTWTPTSAPTSPHYSPKQEKEKVNEYEYENGSALKLASNGNNASSNNSLDDDCSSDQLQIAKDLLKEIVEDKEFFEKLCSRPQLVKRVFQFVFNKV